MLFKGHGPPATPGHILNFTNDMCDIAYLYLDLTALARDFFVSDATKGSSYLVAALSHVPLRN